MEKCKKRMLIGVVAVCMIITAVLCGDFLGNEKKITAPKDEEYAENMTKPSEEQETAPETIKNSENVAEGKRNTPQSAQRQEKIAEVQIDDAVYDEEKTAPKKKTENKPQQAPAEEELTCRLSVRCDTILNNFERLDKAKTGIVPADGVIFAEKTVTVHAGESVFDILKREMKNSKIHLEFVNTPVYNSTYVEGIANLYEFDCGELSGWMYRVDGEFPKCGSSSYKIKGGEKIEWIYTCDLGRDIGGDYTKQTEG